MSNRRIPHSSCRRSRSSRARSKLEQRFLVDRGKTVHARDAGFDEIVITAGMKVSVHGAVRFEVVPGEATYRETGKRIVISAPPGHPLTIGRPL